MLSMGMCIEEGQCVEGLGSNGGLSTKILDSLLSDKSYDKLIRPSPQTNVSLQVEVQNIDLLDDVSMEVGISMKLRLFWTDPRHNFQRFLTHLQPDSLPEFPTTSSSPTQTAFGTLTSRP